MSETIVRVTVAMETKYSWHDFSSLQIHYPPEGLHTFQYFALSKYIRRCQYLLDVALNYHCDSIVLVMTS
jgi:hypothetical protein